MPSGLGCTLKSDGLNGKPFADGRKRGNTVWLKANGGSQNENHTRIVEDVYLSKKVGQPILFLSFILFQTNLFRIYIR